MTIDQINDGEYKLPDMAGGKFFVNLHRKSCSCRFWDVEMIPCPHAMVASHKEDMMSEDMITEKYYQGLKAYIHSLLWFSHNHVCYHPGQNARQGGPRSRGSNQESR
ncbi:unnamed protein product [Cochlearia groenlandica]